MNCSTEIIDFIVSHEKKILTYLLMIVITCVTCKLFTHKPFINWISPSVEGDDGKASGIRIIAMSMALTVIWMAFQVTVRGKDVGIELFIVFLSFIATCYGIVFGARIAQSIKKPKKENDEQAS